MPTYDYRCKACKHEFEQFQSMSAKPLTKCPECGKNALERLIGIGAAVMFKGSGFYQTDYRSESYRKAAEADAKASTGGEKKPDAKTESKPDAKTETKTETKTEKKSEAPSEAKSEPKPERPAGRSSAVTVGSGKPKAAKGPPKKRK